MSSGGKPSSRSDYDGMMAWSGGSAGYSRVVINLTSASKYSGNTLRIRWTIATDGSSAGSYWFVDDVSIVTDGTVNDPFSGWSGGGGFAVDSNGDGVSDGLAWALGAASSSTDALSLMPVADGKSEPAFLIFNYRRLDEAKNDPATSFAVEFGTSMGGWTTASHDGTNTIITEYNDDYGAGVDRIEVKLRKSAHAVGGKLFSRLKVTRTP